MIGWRIFGDTIFLKKISIAMAVLLINAAMAFAENKHLPGRQSEKPTLKKINSANKLPQKLKGHGGPVKSIHLDHSGKWALSSSFDYSIILWKLEGQNGQIKHRMIGHKAAVNDVAFVPVIEGQSKRAVSVSDDGNFGIWNLETGKLIKMIEDSGDKVIDVDVSTDGKLAAVARWDGTARVYHLEQQKEIYRFEGHRGNVNAVLFHKQSQTLFTASYDGDIRVWYLNEDKPNKFIQHGSVLLSHGWGINVLALLPDGKSLVYGALNGYVGVVDIKTAKTKKIGSFEHPILSIAVNKSSSWFATGGGDGHIRVFDNKKLTLLEEYKDYYGPIWGLSFSTNGKRLYRVGLDDFVGAWQVQPRKGFEKSQSKFPRRFQVRNSENAGEAEFQRKCSVCHTLIEDDKNRAGPTLYKLFGRKAGSVKGYAYSKALLESDIIWNEETIGRLFDEGPDIVTPGTKMPIQRLKSVERRDALINYLKSATEPKVTKKK